MKRVCICGSFGFGKRSLNGQTIKTEIITKYYLSEFGDRMVATIDTQGFINIILVPVKLLWAYLSCDNVIILPAQNALRLLAPICRLYQSLTDKTTHYIVIGGWLPYFLKKHPLVSRSIRKYRGVYVETNTMKIAMQSLGFKNVFVLPNCKYLNIVDEDNNGNRNPYPPLRLCTFSRINRKKGIEDAVKVVESINSELGEGKVLLDIYGKVDDGEQDWFDCLTNHLPYGVSIKEAIPYDKSVDILKKYHALLFPTRYYTEGIPGTIIDAFAAGVPVIASKWESCNDVVTDGITGYLYDFCDNKALKNTVIRIIAFPQKLIEMRENCLRAAHLYLPNNVMRVVELS